MRKLIDRSNLHILLLYTLLSFPLFYFVYKFGVLLAGYEDAKSYFKLFADLSSKEVPSPFNMRLLSPALIHLLHQTGLFYNTECAMDAFPAFDKSYFFTNLFYNFIIVSLTCFSIYLTFFKLGFSKALAFMAGVLYLLGFGTIFYQMMPGVDSLSILLFSWMFYYYLQKNYLIILLLLPMVFQREYYFLFFILMAGMDYFFKGKNKFHLVLFATAFMGWTIYFLLRKYVFFTPHWHYQTSASNLMSILLSFQQDFVTMFRQTFMTMNICFIYLLILAYKKSRNLPIDKYQLLMSLLLFIQITLVSIATTSGNNNGRYFYLATPYFLYLILKEIAPYINISMNFDAELKSK